MVYAGIVSVHVGSIITKPQSTHTHSLRLIDRWWSPPPPPNQPILPNPESVFSQSSFTFWNCNLYELYLMIIVQLMIFYFILFYEKLKVTIWIYSIYLTELMNIMKFWIDALFCFVFNCLGFKHVIQTTYPVFYIIIEFVLPKGYSSIWMKLYQHMTNYIKLYELAIFWKWYFGQHWNIEYKNITD